MLSVSWVKCGDVASWCPFDNVDLSKVTASGVYIIWHEGNPGRAERHLNQVVPEHVRKSYFMDKSLIASDFEIIAKAKGEKL